MTSTTNDDISATTTTDIEYMLLYVRVRRQSHSIYNESTGLPYHYHCHLHRSLPGYMHYDYVELCLRRVAYCLNFTAEIKLQDIVDIRESFMTTEEITDEVRYLNDASYIPTRVNHMVCQGFQNIKHLAYMNYKCFCHLYINEHYSNGGTLRSLDLDCLNKLRLRVRDCVSLNEFITLP